MSDFVQESRLKLSKYRQKWLEKCTNKKKDKFIVKCQYPVSKNPSVWLGDLKFVSSSRIGTKKFSSTQWWWSKSRGYVLAHTNALLWYELQKNTHFSQSGMNEARIWPSQHKQKIIVLQIDLKRLFYYWDAIMQSVQRNLACLLHWLDSEHLLHKTKRSRRGPRPTCKLNSIPLLSCFVALDFCSHILSFFDNPALIF